MSTSRPPDEDASDANGAPQSGEPQRIAAPPENICVCFHVPLVKLIAFIRIRKPKVASQLSECFGAGTGCGWCIPFLERLFEASQRGEDPAAALDLETADYLERRRLWREKIRADRMRDERPGDDAAPTSD